jgi:hypothetical protein
MNFLTLTRKPFEWATDRNRAHAVANSDGLVVVEQLKDSTIADHSPRARQRHDQAGKFGASPGTKPADCSSSLRHELLQRLSCQGRDRDPPLGRKPLRLLPN